MSRSFGVLCLVWPIAVQAQPKTCGELQTLHNDKGCCGNPDKQVQVCPYSFAKPSCDTAEVQSPRDLSTGATGKKVPKAPTLNSAQTASLPLVNVHFHLGAEHKSDAYNDGSFSAAYDSYTNGRRLAESPRPGWMCPTQDLTAAELKPYPFQHCKGDVAVGKTYEVHYVHSSAGVTAADVLETADMETADLLSDGLGGAANGRGLLNPMVAVQGQVFLIVNGDDAPVVDDLVHGWQSENVDHSNSVMYSGSTTGPSHNNDICSPYAITWHVDRACHKVSAQSFDKMCADMSSMYNLYADLYPHGSRILVDEKYVVPAEYVISYV